MTAEAVTQLLRLPGRILPDPEELPIWPLRYSLKNRPRFHFETRQCSVPMWELLLFEG